MNRMFSRYLSKHAAGVRVSAIVLATLVVSACTTTGPRPSVTNQQVQTQSDKALIHAQLAKNYLQQKQYAVAKNELETALKIDANHSDSNYVMALLMMELKQLEVAEKHFNRAVKSNRQNSAAAHDFGMFLCQTGRERKAVEYFEIAAENPLFGKSELSYMRAGECLSKINDAQAETYLKRALQVNSRLRPALYRLAQINNDNQSYLSARAYIERFLAITDPQPESLLLAYKIESNLNATDVAAEYRRQLLADFPGSREAGQLRNKLRDLN